MKKTRLNRLISLVLVAMIMFPGSLRVTAAEVVTDPGYEEGTGTDENEEAFSLNDNLLEPVASGDATQIHKPRKNTNSGETVTTWDCIWFGNYWQEDTNGDGHCFERDTTVTKHKADYFHSKEYYTDQDGREMYGFDGEAKTYQADKKQPIKWRVLDINDNGNALLLADKLIDIVEYDESTVDVTWETCTMRSYLNGYDGSNNFWNKDFSINSGNRSFLYSAFNDAEIKCLIESEVKNPNNPVWGNTGGNTTYDRLFCLSLEEAMNGDYGFIKNEFTNSPPYSEKKYYTDDDPTRVAVTTKFTDDKPDYSGEPAGTSAWWWLRSPGDSGYSASDVRSNGAAYATSSSYVRSHYGCARPAFRMNLSSSSSLWTYAGTVSSDGTVVEENPEPIISVIGVSLPATGSVKVGESITLTPDISPSNATDKTVTWKSSAEGVATVSTKGVVTGVSEGTVDITVTTSDGGHQAVCALTVEKSKEQGSVSIHKPSTTSGVSTWDCIWFGNYWQEDTNGDGHCYSEDYTSGSTTYKADSKQPIKWRVLDIDGSGNALLLADKLIDIVEYSETNNYTSVTWETCTMRSYLNGYDGSKNVCNKDFSEKSGNRSFVYNAFNDDEINCLIESEVKNPNNPVYGTTGGNTTHDWLFCLSLEEAMNGDYGFIKNEFTGPSSGTKYYTDYDPTRVAVTTKFTDDKPGYGGHTAGESDRWWLRSPGYNSYNASLVNWAGAAYVNYAHYGADYCNVDDDSYCARPAFRMNLSSSSSLWDYAGTVDSNGIVDEKERPGQRPVHVTGVSLPPEEIVKTGGSVTLSPVIEPEDATDKSVTWKSSAPEIASVDNGVVTGIREGTATITVTTGDRGFTDTCDVKVINYVDPGIKKPVKEGDTSTWDCIWFGNYWQEDTNGDGYCFNENTTVSKTGKEYYDQYGRKLYNFTGSEGTYNADEKQPIKWRVLDIDGSGNALLLADKLIDIVQYNETSTSVTWETCTMRSYLNGYTASQNICGKNFSEKSGNRSFLYSAFNDPEINCLIKGEVKNPNNPVYGTAGGNITYDRLFCLSLDEAMNGDYGFIKNEFTKGESKLYYTDGDSSRVAVTTKFADDKPGYYGETAGTSGPWSLRSPGLYSYYASFVYISGAACADDSLSRVDSLHSCLRPAFRMNLSSSSSLWDYAGTVDSNGIVDEKERPVQRPVHVTGVSLPPEEIVKTGGSVTLSPVIEPEDATDKSVTWKSSAPEIASVDNGVVTGISEGTATITVTTGDRGFTDTCDVKVINYVDPGIKKPVKEGDTSTWDCIWFGNYWQEDTNGDGRCYAEETTVEGTTYPADKKQPIKWRVLDIDDKGNALLLADKLIDIVQYNETRTDVTWETCTMRSYLNGYDGSKNVCNKDFSEKSGNRSFVYSAFNDPEINCLIESEVKNPRNPVYGTTGGNTTYDRLFCLSLEEAMNEDYGFIKNDFTNPSSAEKKYYTDNDSSREAVTTKFTDDKPGYYGNTAGTSGYWWLRSPGDISTNASYVGLSGAAYAISYYVLYYNSCLRPAFRMNLSSSSSLWDYAGTVDSNGIVDEKERPVHVTGVSLPPEEIVKTGGSVTLSPVIEPEDATDKSVTWKSSAPEIASVDNGVVTGIREGTATITVTTGDRGFTDTCDVKVINYVDPGIKKPVKEGDTSTWDCIWFGNYWQEDTNGDGRCYAEETTVEGTTYPADKQQPIKWRVLDIDDKGNALLLADKLIDIVQYNETYTDVTWETCTMRSYLNGYDGSKNVCNKDFSEKSGNRSFVYSAFNDAEINCLINGEVNNPNNPVHGTTGGNTTHDWLFCLSLEEAMNGDYGFIKNEFTNGGSKPYYTDSDSSRVAVTTKFTDDKPGYYGNTAGTAGWWWLRSPGYGSSDASYVYSRGAVYAGNYSVDYCDNCIRPAFRMNLSSSSSLWTYAGTVCSDGTGKELVAVKDVSLNETAEVYVGKTITLTPDISPSDATDKTVTWKSSSEGVATVSTEGVVTGITEGSADITVTTKDGGFSATCRVIVTKPGPDTIPVNGVTLPATGSVKVGKTLTPEISPSDATDKTVTWKSSSEGVATVSTEGVVTGITEGISDITVTTKDGGFSATCRVTVTKEGTDPGPDPSEEDLEKDIDVDATDRSFDMLPGEIRRLPINKTGKYVYGVSYVSSDPKTVSVKNGVVTAKNLKKGEMEKKATVTATYNGESVPFVITVKAGIPTITAGQKGNKITAPKTVKADVGTSKSVTASVKLPKALRGQEVKAKVVLPENLPEDAISPGDTENAIFDLGEGKPNEKGTKVSFEITPKEAGAAYIVWTVTDDSGNISQAYTKVLIKKPLNKLFVSSAETGLDLSVGEGKRLLAATTTGNTDSKDLSFSVKGKGVKVSKSGFVTAITPGATADVTVKAGKYQKTVTVRVKDHTSSILALNKTSVNVKRPKEGAKPKTVALKVTMPKKNPPEVTWSITDSPNGIIVDSYGNVIVTSDASPGCYTVAATPEDPGSGYNPVCCELIVK